MTLQAFDALLNSSTRFSNPVLCLMILSVEFNTSSVQASDLRVSFQTTHKLDYLQSPEGVDLGEGRIMHGFKVGTCHGLFFQTDEAVCLLAVENDECGNGHFTDVLEWFEYSAANQNLYFDVVEVWNQRLKWHLIDKRGFAAIGQFHLRKRI